MNSIRKALEGVPLSAAAEAALAAAEKKEREDAAYIDWLEHQLERSRKETPEQRSIYRQEWERTKSPDRGPSRLDEAQEKILLTLAARDGMWAVHVAAAAGVGEQVAQYHLDELQEKEMVRGSYAVGERTEWFLDHEGRGYLIKHKLIR